MIHSSLAMLLAFLGTVVVGQRWPHPRWFIGTGSSPPPVGNFVILTTGDFVVLTAGDSVVVN